MVAGCLRSRVGGVEPCESGENHAVYKLTYVDPAGEAKDVVVRVASSASARDCATATREAAVLRKVQRIAAPVLHDFRCDNEWFGAPVMCTDFVDGVQRAPRGAAELELLGRTVGRVHALPTHDLGDAFADAGTVRGYFDEQLATLVENSSWVRDPLPADVQRRLRQALARVAEHAAAARRSGDFETSASLVLLHGDVAGGNIFWTPDPVLIDWEYARIGDPADEVAYIFTQHGCSEEERARFWNGYGRGRADARAVEHGADRVRWWEPVTALGSAFFWVRLWSRRLTAEETRSAEPTAPRSSAYYAQQALPRLRRFEDLLPMRG